MVFDVYLLFLPSPSRLCANLGYVKTVNCCSHEPSIGRKISKRRTSTAAPTASPAAPATSTTSATLRATRRRKRSSGSAR